MPLPGSDTSTDPKNYTGSGRQSLAASAYNTIYRNIISLVFEPGQRLEENQLVEQLGIGRTPIREALLRLAADLLVESSPGKGYTVRPITIQDTKAAFDALLIMELGVAQLAVRQETSRILTMMESANEAVETVRNQSPGLPVLWQRNRTAAVAERALYLSGRAAPADHRTDPGQR
jgi:DNA-binding GntR family transcriptional regulator